MKKTLLLCLALLILIAKTPSAFAVANRWAIQWTAPPDVYVQSLYIGVLGRQPENPQVVTDWARNVIDGKPQSRLGVFWGFIRSPEYQSRPWAKFTKQWLVIRTKERTARVATKLPEDCNFYWVTKSPRHGQKVIENTKQTYLVAQALLNYHATFDEKTCPGGGVVSGRANPAVGGAPVPPVPPVAPGQAANPNLPAVPANPELSGNDQALQQTAERQIIACAFNKASATIGLIRTQSIRSSLSNKLDRARKRETNVRRLYSQATTLNTNAREHYNAGNNIKAVDAYKKARVTFKQARSNSQCQSVRKVIDQALAAVDRNLNKAVNRQASLKQQKKQLWKSVETATARWIKFKCRKGSSGCAYEPPLVKELLSYKVLGAATSQKLMTAQKIFTCTDQCIMADGSPKQCYHSCEKQYER